MTVQIMTVLILTVQILTVQIQTGNPDIHRRRSRGVLGSGPPQQFGCGSSVPRTPTKISPKYFNISKDDIRSGFVSL